MLLIRDQGILDSVYIREDYIGLEQESITVVYYKGGTVSSGF